MNNHEEDLRKLLNFKAEASRHFGSVAIIEEFLLRNGRFWPGAPYSGKRGVMKECFKNAFELALENPSLRYVEGKALRLTLGIEVDHAWCVTEDDVVVDCTWDRPEEGVYFGYKFETEAVRQKILKSRFYSMFWTNGSMNVGLMMKIDPDMALGFPEHIQKWMATEASAIGPGRKRRK